MYRILLNMDMPFGEAFECNYSQHSTEDQHDKLLSIGNASSKKKIVFNGLNACENENYLLFAI